MGYFGSFKNRTQNQAKVHNKPRAGGRDKLSRDETLTDWQGREGNGSIFCWYWTQFRRNQVKHGNSYREGQDERRNAERGRMGWKCCSKSCGSTKVSGAVGSREMEAMHLACVQKNAQDGDDNKDEHRVVEVSSPPRRSEKLEAWLMFVLLVVVCRQDNQFRIQLRTCHSIFDQGFVSCQQIGFVYIPFRWTRH